jgi:lysine 2,3-aminomutase
MQNVYLRDMNKNVSRTIDLLRITPHAKKVLDKLLKENPDLNALLLAAGSVEEASEGIRRMAMDYMKDHPHALAFYRFEAAGREALEKLEWRDYAAIRILDYLDHAGRTYEDLNLHGKRVANDPFKMLWLATKFGEGGAQANFFTDMRHLFRQFRGLNQKPEISREKILEWMDRYPSGLDPAIIRIREKNKDRIIRVLAEKIAHKEIRSPKFSFPEGLSKSEQLEMVGRWWDDHSFHLRFAVRTPGFLNELLDHTLDEETMEVLNRAEKRGIPFFINPYYLSLLNVNAPEFARGADMAIRYYIIYSRQLVQEYGQIVAWEKEDVVEPGKPNAAGWILPTKHNIHRRYPEVAIMIPDTMGRACAGLCASCQRMYDFQRGNLNFNLDKLKPTEAWDAKLDLIMKYWEGDSRLRDILITGGDALMSANHSLKKILDAVYNMAVNKKKINEALPDGEKLAEILRVRLGTRLPVYLPQRITPELTEILAEFKEKASKIGVKQFVIQTHFQSPMEVTPESRLGISRLIGAGWTVANQLVFTAAASRRGHTAKLRKVLNDIGVLPYYTFSVKGYMENSFKFATNARAAQEQMEEKVIGIIPARYKDEIKRFPMEAEKLVENIRQLREEAGIPFLATDRNVLNLPGVGKSMTYRVIGITRAGRRILEFDHDHTRSHSPIVDKIGKFVIIESKSVANYLEQLEDMDENKREYESIWAYSIGETEPRTSIYEYPDFAFRLTEEITNFKG